MIKKTLLLFFFAFTCSFAQMFAPQIVVQNNEHDFGDIPEGTSVTHNYIVTNSGGDLLKINKVRASCGCTAANPEKNELPPGESTTIKVTFNSSGRLGKQEKYVFINSNDPKNPEMKLKFTCNVVQKEEKKVSQEFPRIQFASDQHDFGKVKEGKVVDYVFDFKNEGKSILEIKDIKTSCGCTAALVSSKKIEPGQKGTLKVELDTKDRSGRMSRTISVKTNDPEQPDKVLTIYAEIVKE